MDDIQHFAEMVDADMAKKLFYWYYEAQLVKADTKSLVLLGPLLFGVGVTVTPDFSATAEALGDALAKDMPGYKAIVTNYTNITNAEYEERKVHEIRSVMTKAMAAAGGLTDKMVDDYKKLYDQEIQKMEAING